MILVNGEVQAQLSATDRGLHYGDGLFETIAIHNGQPEWWEQHMARLRCGAERLQLPTPDPQQLEQEVMQLIECSNGERQVLKILYTRGSGGRGYRFPEEVSPTRILSLNPWPYADEVVQQAVEQGIRLHLCDTRLAEQPALAGIKHLNRLEQILARNEWSDPGINEGAVMNGADQLIEGTMSNLFFVKGGEIITPDLSGCGVAGVVREVLMEQQAVTIRPVAVTELPEMDEAFCSNSLIHIWPICQIGEVHFGMPGAVTKDCIRYLKGGS